jgi:uncharacterized DUF497 family protein
MFEWNEDKAANNKKAHNVSFDAVENFEFTTALVTEDTRKVYSETRYAALGFIANRLHVLVYCIRANNIRVISLRKANRRERQRYDRER